MYQTIRSRKSVPTLYEEKLIVKFSYYSHRESRTDSTQDEGVLTTEEATSLRSSYRSKLEDAMASVDSWKPSASMLEAQWTGCVWPASNESQRDPETGLDIETLKKVGHASVEIPAGFVSNTRKTCLLVLTPVDRKSTLGSSDMSSAVRRTSMKGRLWIGLPLRYVSTNLNCLSSWQREHLGNGLRFLDDGWRGCSHLWSGRRSRDI
jgi:hypothetical protein